MALLRKGFTQEIGDKFCSMKNKIAIIGSGIAGVSAARVLTDAGFTVTIFEKARGPGGRMSTRRTDFGSFDHGAQYFTIRDPGFVNFLRGHDFYARWQGSFGLWTSFGLSVDPNDELRYVCTPGMNALCKALIDGYEYKTSSKIINLSKKSGWMLEDDAGDHFGPFSWVISTAPPKQSIDLMGYFLDIPDTKMHPCFTVMVSPHGNEVFPFDGIRFDDHPVLGWCANNHSKPIRDSKPALVIQTSFMFSQTYVDAPLEEVQKRVIEAIKDTLSLDLSGAEFLSIHRWLYSSPVGNSGGKTVQNFICDPIMNLIACGDWAAGRGRVELAWQSGFDAATYILENA